MSLQTEIYPGLFLAPDSGEVLAKPGRTRQEIVDYLQQLRIVAPDLLIEKNPPKRPMLGAHLRGSVPAGYDPIEELETVELSDFWWIAQLYITAQSISYAVFDTKNYALDYCVAISTGLRKLLENVGLNAVVSPVYFYQHEAFRSTEMAEKIPLWSELLGLPTGIVIKLVHHFWNLNGDVAEMARMINLLFEGATPLPTPDQKKAFLAAMSHEFLAFAHEIKASPHKPNHWLPLLSLGMNRWHNVVMIEATDGLLYADVNAQQFHPPEVQDAARGIPFFGFYHPLVLNFEELPGMGIFPIESEAQLQAQFQVSK